MTSPIDIRPDHLAMVQDVLRAHLPDGAEAWVFGSRATWTTKDSSDLDLAVQANGKITPRVMGELEDAFRESDLPYTVDVVDLAAVDGRFKQVVKSQKVSLPLGLDAADGRSEWRMVKFGDCATLVRDTVSPSNYMETPYIGLEHIGVDTLSLLDVGIAGDVSSAKSRFQSGDVLFGKLRPYFRKVIRARFDGICSTDIWVVRPTDGVDAGYLFYVMASQDFVDVAMQGSEGTKMPRAKWEYVSRHEIPLPPLSEQRDIAHILGTFDDKIDLNRRMNETLEEMARALFTSWFVDYDPVHAKMDGRWRRGESLPGLPADLYDMFPARMVESELGEVPDGWEVRGLGEVVEYLRNNENPFKDPETMFTHFSIPAHDDGQMPRQELGTNIKSAKSSVPSDSVLFSRLNPEIERVWLVDVQPDDRAVCSTEFMVLGPQSHFQRCYIYCLGRSPSFRQQFESLVTGTSKSHQRAPAGAVLSLKVVVPPEHVIGEFEKVASAFLNRTLANRRESQTLSALRDILLPRLVSGEVWVGGSVREREAREQ